MRFWCSITMKNWKMILIQYTQWYQFISCVYSVPTAKMNQFLASINQIEIYKKHLTIFYISIPKAVVYCTYMFISSYIITCIVSNVDLICHHSYNHTVQSKTFLWMLQFVCPFVVIFFTLHIYSNSVIPIILNSTYHAVHRCITA